LRQAERERGRRRELERRKDWSQEMRPAWLLVLDRVGRYKEENCMCNEILSLPVGEGVQRQWKWPPKTMQRKMNEQHWTTRMKVHERQLGVYLLQPFLIQV